MRKTESTDIPEPVRMSSASVESFNSKGLRNESRSLNLIDECRVALSGMPEGKVGLSIGTGRKTEDFKELGWNTLDIDPESDADIIADANNLEEVVPKNSLDYVHMEAVPFRSVPLDVENVARTGVNPTRLLSQVNRALKVGGRLMFKTANFHSEINGEFPTPEYFMPLLGESGFRGVVELGERSYKDKEKTKFEQQIIYYAEKIRDVQE